MAVAYINERLRQKNASGDYDIMHLESESGLILRSGTTAGTFKTGTVEDALTTLEGDVTTLKARNVELTGDVSGTGVLNGNNIIVVDTEVSDDSHSHTGSTVTIAGATDGNFLAVDASGHPVDSTKKASDFAAASHNHNASDINAGTLGVARGGTGKGSVTAGNYLVGNGTSALAEKTPAQVLSDIGAAASSHTHGLNTGDITGTLPITKGGTGATTAAGALTNLGAAAADHNHDTVYLKTTQKGVANGLAELDSTGKVPAAQLPSYVDDVIEGYYYNNKFYEESSHTTEITPESGKIYVDKDTNKTYRWSGTAYVEISASLALGETHSTAYYGDLGKVAYEHSQSAHAPANASVVTDPTSGDGKIKVNDVEMTVYTHPSYTAKAAGFYKVTVDATGHVSAATAVAASDVKGLTGIDMTAASASAAGTHGMVPAPAAGDQDKILSGAGTWVARYSHPTKTPVAAAAKKVGYDNLGHVVLGDALTASDVGAAPASHTHLWADITDKPTTFTPSAHNHNASDINAGTLGVTHGGTGVTANPSMLINLGSTDAANVFAASPRPGVTGTLALANGGTGATTAAGARANLGVINVQSGSTQPTNQAAGDLWYETI